MECLAGSVEMRLVGRPLAALDAGSEFDRASSVLVVDAVDAAHQTTEFAVVFRVKHIELYAASVLDVEGHDTRFAVGKSIAPDVVQSV